MRSTARVQEADKSPAAKPRPLQGPASHDGRPSTPEEIAKRIEAAVDQARGAVTRVSAG